MRIVILSSTGFERKLQICIDESKKINDSEISLLMSSAIYDEVSKELRSNSKVDYLTINNNTVYLIDDMRIYLNKVYGVIR